MLPYLPLKSNYLNIYSTALVVTCYFYVVFRQTRRRSCGKTSQLSNQSTALGRHFKLLGSHVAPWMPGGKSSKHGGSKFEMFDLARKFTPNRNIIFSSWWWIHCRELKKASKIFGSQRIRVWPPACDLSTSPWHRIQGRHRRRGKRRVVWAEHV